MDPSWTLASKGSSQVPFMGLLGVHDGFRECLVIYVPEYRTNER